MAKSIPNGAYKDAAGNYQDAQGQPLSKEATAAAEKLFAEQREQRAETHRLFLLAEAQRDPLTRALGGLAPQDQSARIAALEAQLAAATKAGK